MIKTNSFGEKSETNTQTITSIDSNLKTSTNYVASSTEKPLVTSKMFQQTTSRYVDGWQCINNINKCFRLTNSLNIHGKSTCFELGESARNASFENPMQFKYFINALKVTDEFWLNLHYVNNTWVWIESG